MHNQVSTSVRLILKPFLFDYKNSDSSSDLELAIGFIEVV